MTVGGEHRAVIDRLDELHLRCGEQWTEQAGNEVRAPVEQVGVEEDEDVASGHVERLPERFALAAGWRQVGADPGSGVDGGSGGMSLLRGRVDGVGVDDDQLVDEWGLVDPGAADGVDDGADGGLLVAGRDDDADGQPGAGLGGDEVGDGPVVMPMDLGRHGAHYSTVTAWGDDPGPARGRAPLGAVSGPRMSPTGARGRP